MKKTFLMALVCAAMFPAMAWAQAGTAIDVFEGVPLNNLPTVLAGDVLIFEHPGDPNPSDLLRFVDRGDRFSNQAFLFSDVETNEVPPDPFDIPIPPPPFQQNNVSIAEDLVGGTLYQALSGMPGSDPFTPNANMYLIHSDPVPEPASWVLLGLGMVGLYGVSRRKATAL